MNPVLHLLAPMALLLPALAAVEAPAPSAPAPIPVTPASAEQVSIEQRVTIRINARPAPVRMEGGFMDADMREPQFIERKMGNCLPMNAIAGIQPVSSNKLLLIMRDDRLVTAQLEKGCQAREFYSGLIVDRASDGQMCVQREELKSRSGATCQVVAFRHLIPVGN